MVILDITSPCYHIDFPVTVHFSVKYDEKLHTDEGRGQKELSHSAEVEEGVEERSTEHTDEGRGLT